MRITIAMNTLSTHDFYYYYSRPQESEMATEPVSISNSKHDSVYYEVETSTGKKAIVVHEIGEVYIYIPAELSAAGFEIKIAGSVRITDKGDQFYVNWTPVDLTQQDVASLYSAQADGWTVVDEFVEPPEVIDSHELRYPDSTYYVPNLDATEPILKQKDGKSPSPTGKGRKREDKALKNRQRFSKTSGGSQSSQDGDALISGIVSSSKLSQTPEAPRAEAVNFPLEALHSARESQHQNSRSLTFFLSDGCELPTLYFHDGGTTSLLQAMQRYTFLVKDPKDPTLFRTEVFDKSKRSAKLKPVESQLDQSSQPGKKGIDTQQVQEFLHGAVTGAVGNFIGITRAVRQHLLPEKQLLEVRPGTEGEDDFDEKIQTMAFSDVVKSQPGSTPTSPSSSETTSAAVPTASSSSSSSSKTVAKNISKTDPETSLITDFQIITDLRGNLPDRPPQREREYPIAAREWESYRDDRGQISPQNEKQLKARIFAGGVEPSLRKEVWKYLLGYFPFQVTDIERMDLRLEKEKEYWRMKQQWQSFTPDQESRFSKWREMKSLINKDVLRTDRDIAMYKGPDSVKLVQLEEILRTYVMFNFDLGYVQGMSDLLAPLLAVMDNEVDTFWCFVGFMQTVEHHFEMSQSGMRNRLKQLRALLNLTDPEFYQFLKGKDCNNLYFCFRWLLVHFKREFSYDDIITIWEVIWTNYLSPDYALFISLAILEREKEALHKPKNDFSDILSHINMLAKNIPVKDVLELAEALCRQLGSCSSLPDDLQPLVNKPFPKLSSMEGVTEGKSDVVICNPDSRAVPTV